MMNFTSVMVFLYILSWISASVSEFHTVQVPHGEDVTVNCTNFTSFPVHIFWFRLAGEPNVTRISSMSSSDSNATFFGTFLNGRFTMTSNSVTIFLNIKHVDLSDSGLYFCGFNENGKAVIAHATHLKVTQEMFVEWTKMISMVLAGVILFLMIVIVILVVKIRKRSAPDEGQNPEHTEAPGSDNLNYAALNFKQKPKNNHKPASQRQMETDVVYAATR